MSENKGADSNATVRVERQGRVATLTLDRPPLNILDLDTLRRLDEAVKGLADEKELQVVVVRGAGAKAFSAGVAVEDHTPEKVPGVLRHFHEALLTLMDLPAPCVAAVHGHCLGGGMELALACDIVVAERSATFGQPEVKLGCFPPFAAALYPRRIGRNATFDLLATGRTIDGEEALRLGVVDRLADDGGLDAAVDEVVGQLTGQSAAVLNLIERAVSAGAGMFFPQALVECERLYTEELLRTEDVLEGLAAFREKRDPEWKHR